MTSAPEIADAASDLRSEDPDRVLRGVKTMEAQERQGDPTAAYAVGTWFLHGVHGYAQDEARAAPLLQYAADRGVPSALFDLGVLIETRRLGTRPRREAFSNYLAAALLGDRDAAQEVVRCVYHGIGAFADPRGAERLFDVLHRGEQRLIAAE